jgi:S-adenosylmethionine/arginine decarboxylase-like enzyme
MKKSELKKYVRENIISELSENTEDEITKTKELTQAVQDLDTAKKEAGIEENEDNWADYTDIGQSYLEGFGKEHTLTDNQLEKLGKKIVKQLYKGDIGKAYDAIVKRDLKEAENVGLADLEEMGYNAADDFFETNVKQHLNSSIDFRYYLKGLRQGLSDAANSYGLNENQAKTVDDVIDPADYGDIGKGYLEGFDKPNSLNADQLETLGRKIVKQLYKGDFDKAKAKFIKEDLREDEDAEPTKSDIKKTKGLAKAKEELALLTREMKSLAKKYSKAEGADKEKLVKVLKDKTKLKKELESILDNKKI